MKKIIALFFVFVLVLLNAADFSIGETKIKLPVMPGYINSADVHPELNAHLGRLMKEQYSVPASYILTSDAEIIKKSSNKRLFEEMGYNSHVMICFLNKLANYSCRQDEFDVVKNSLKKIYSSDFKLLENKLKEQEKYISEKGKFKYNTDKIIPAGIIFENNDCIISSMVVNHKFDDDIFSQACSMGILKIKNKIFYVYVYKDFKTKKDLEYTQKNVKILVQKFFELNK
ncbi:MAG: hypothetical protein IKB71_08620 [Lentisphaeria bacterium]|nr:hypothetical protein [Lentisphaeria bacterium]